MNYRRNYQAGGYYFFTVVTHNRQPILIDNINVLRDAFRYVMHKHPFQIDAIVILPDHLHTIWQLPANDTNYSLRWSLLKRHFSTHFPPSEVSVSKQKRREKGIWQRRFWEHTLRDEDDWQRHMDYLHYNPVKHGFVDTPLEWEFSSFKREISRGFYVADWGKNGAPGTIVGMKNE